ncbi:hypothetical protein KC678_04340 [Candidatus Dojkabacteria bacterium]|uniref:Uncharacterized protein n=1 Tax=Candidatus Dojkabacteria bacterium TaxID=2099670 RepID=A0A955L264_9BACT|nr:hypothetical protein [Candidatus Dojkabacteria bacterium]
MNKLSFLKLPKNPFGKMSVYFSILFFIFLSIFFFNASLDIKGSDTFLGNPHLAIPISLAGISGFLSCVLGIWSVLKYKERSIVVYISVLIGAFVCYWIIGEVFTPH